MPRLLLGVLVLVLLALALEAATTSNLINPQLFPPPSRIFSVLTDGDFARDTLQQVALTLGRAAAGLLLALITAVPAGLLLGSVGVLRAAFMPMVELLRPIPSSAMVPVAILFLGLGDSMIVFVIWFGTFWTILLSAIYGAMATDRVHKDVAKLLKLPQHTYFRLIVLPSAIPNLFAGTRIALAIALILAVTAEMLGGQDGLGFQVLDYERAFRYPEMYATLFTLAVLGLTANVVLTMAQRRLARRFPQIDAG